MHVKLGRFVTTRSANVASNRTDRFQQ